MAMHIMTNFIDDIPNISTDMINDVRGQLVTPQNTLTAENPDEKNILT